MSNEVPTRVRLLVQRRERRRCLRCGGPGSQFCHRRTRAVKDEHQHCACNAWYGCHTCHQTWQHANPTRAMVEGFAVSRHVDQPGRVEVQSFYGTILLRCDGDIEFVVKDRSNDADPG